MDAEHLLKFKKFPSPQSFNSQVKQTRLAKKQPYIHIKIKYVTVSSICTASPQIFAISRVLHFPPIESFSTCVSLLCLNGTCSRRLSPKAITACSRNVSDLLIYMASTCVSPIESVFPSLSDPARSTKFSLEVTYFVLDSTRECDSM